MMLSHTSRSTQKTILVVNTDVDVLVAMRGILQNHYRVLLATDDESALRLLTIDGLRIDLAVLDSNADGLQQRMTELLPQFRTLSMAAVVESGVMRLRGLGAPGERNSNSLVQRIESALAGSGDASIQARVTTTLTNGAGTGVLVAGRA